MIFVKGKMVFFQVERMNFELLFCISFYTQKYAAIHYPHEMLSLTQQRFFRKDYYEVRDTGFFVAQHSGKTVFEEEIRYEDISNRVNRIERRQPLLVVAAVVCLLLAIAAAFFHFFWLAGLGILLSLVLALVIRERARPLVQIFLRSDFAIQIEAENPDKETVDQFLQGLEREKRKYVINKYGNVDKDLPIEPQLDQLIWLRNEDYIDEKTLDELKNKLLGKQKDAKIGFMRREE